MSDTTVINSKAMQALLSQAESQPGAQAKGATFHQLLEGALTEKAQTATSPASLAKSTLSAEPALGALSTKLAKTLNAISGARKPDAAKQLATSTTKIPLPANAAANDDVAAGDASATTTSSKAGDAKGAADETSKLDVTQLKLVNAPAIPETPPTAAHSTQATGGGRQLTGPQPRSPAALNSQGLATASAAAALAPRGFAAALASAHVANVLPGTLVDQASFDPSLQLSVTPQAAHMSMDTGATGPLIAQLQITNGVADVRLTGDAASLLARHGAELTLGLTAAGLQPGRVEITAPAAAADLQSATSDGTGAGASRSDAQARGGSESPGRDQPGPPKLTDGPTSTVSVRTSHVHVKA